MTRREPAPAPSSGAGDDGIVGSRANGRRGDEGFTLLEMMVSVFVLAVILAAAASGLITFSRTAVDNEHRVLATALNNRLHEELQATPWIDAATYELELEDIAAMTDVPDGVFVEEQRIAVPGQDVADARELVVLEGPSPAGCEGVPECNRRTRVPRAREVMTIDGRDFEVFRFVSWEATDPQVKRFTTLVRWNVLERRYEERFESTRAATAGEAGDPTRPRVIQFQVGPSPSTLDEGDGLLTEDLNVVVRFSHPVSSATLHFVAVDDPPYDDMEEQSGLRLRDVSVALSPAIPEGIGYVSFDGTLPAGAYAFPNGPRSMRVVGMLAGEEYEGTTSVQFVDGPYAPVDDDGEPGIEEPDPDPDPDGDPPPATPVSVGSVLLDRTSLCTNKDDIFASSLTVTVTVAGMTPTDYDVAVTYTVPGEATRTEALFPNGDPATISSAGHVFTRTFGTDQSHGFVLNSNNDSYRTTFSVTANRRSDGTGAGPVSSQTLTVTKRNNPSSCS